MPPFEIGKCYLICTVTRRYVGRVTAADPYSVTLADASCSPHDPADGQRVESIGDVIRPVALAAFASQTA